MASVSPKRPGSAGRGGGRSSSRSTAATASTASPIEAVCAKLQINATGLAFLQPPVKGGGAATARDVRSFTPRSQSSSSGQTSRPGTSLGMSGGSPRPGTSLGMSGGGPRPGTSLGMSGGNPPPRPGTSMGLTDPTPEECSPSKRAHSKEHPSLSKSFCSTELPSTSKSFFSNEQSVGSKAFFSTEVDESFELLADYDDSLLGFTPEPVYRAKDLHLVPMRSPSPAPFNPDQSGPGIMCRLEKEIATQSAKLRIVKEQGISSKKPDSSFPASLQKIRFQEHRFLLDQLVVEHGKHLELLTTCRDLDQLLRTEKGRREELETKNLEEMKWRQETRAKLEQKEKYLSELTQDYEEKRQVMEQEAEENKKKIASLQSECKAMRQDMVTQEREKRDAALAKSNESARNRRHVSELNEKYKRLEFRLNEERYQRSVWEEKAADANQTVESLRRDVEKHCEHETALKETFVKKNQEFSRLCALLETEKEERRKEQEVHEKEKQRSSRQSTVHERAVQHWGRFAHIQMKLGLCRRVLLAQKIVEHEEKRDLMCWKKKNSVRSVISHVKIDNLRKENESLEQQNAELKLLLGLKGHPFGDLPPPEQWGISVSQLKEFRDEISEDMISYCKCHKFYKLEDDPDGIHVCTQQPCPYQDDHRGVPHQEECVAILDGTERLTPLEPNMHVVVNRYVKPQTVGTGKSFALTRNARGLQSTVFITHSWQGHFDEFVKTLDHFLDDQEVVWVCSFALPQVSAEEIEQQLNEELTKTPFALALGEALKHVVVVDRDLDILSRVWCLYELSRGFKLGVPVFLRSCEPRTLLELRIRVSELDCKTAEASHEADKRRIDDAIEKQGGYQELNQYIINCIKDRGNILFDGECLEALGKMDELLEQFKHETNPAQKNRIRQRVEDLAAHALRQQAKMSALSPQQHNDMLKDHEAKLAKLLEYHEERLRDLGGVGDDDDEQRTQLKNAKRATEMEVLANKREQSLLSKMAELNDGAKTATKEFIHEEVDHIQQGIDEALKRHMEALKTGFEQKMVELLDARDSSDKNRFQEAAKQVMHSIQVSRAFATPSKSPSASASASDPTSLPPSVPVSPRQRRRSLTAGASHDLVMQELTESPI